MGKMIEKMQEINKMRNSGTITISEAYMLKLQLLGVQESQENKNEKGIVFSEALCST